MRNKGAILTLTIALALVCLYQLSFTWKAESLKRQAKELAGGDPVKEEGFLDSISNEVVYNILVSEFTFREVQEREINFGLDLKGGMNVILEISTVDVLRSLANNSQDTTFKKALVRAKELQRQTNRDYITLFGEAFEEIDPDASLAAIFTTQELREKINYNTPNDEVLKVVREEAEGAIDNAFNIIATRIDQFGVVQPNIQRLETKDRILVDLPGVKDKNRVRKLLQGTANLEFWETFDNTEIIQSLYSADNMLRSYIATEKQLGKDSMSVQQEAPAPANEQVAEEKTEETTGSPSLLEQIQADTTKADSLPQNIQDAYPLLSILSPMQHPETRQPFPGAAIGRAHFKDTIRISSYLRIAKEKQVFPREVRFMWAAAPIVDDNNKPTEVFYLYAIKARSRDGRPPLNGDVIVSASQEFDNASGNAYVLMSMDAEGTRKWAHITKENLQKVIAVVMDNRVYSAPTVQSEITGGSSQITGNFTPNEAQDLANLLKSGKLPAPARIIQENVVGPSLGQKAVKDGFGSFGIAFVLVLLYMVFYYSRKAGLAADIALMANVFFLIGILASLGAALTLPGIAGIVLTMGMAVDANVIIYERIKEELRAGKGLRLAVTEGYKNSYSAIIDGNVTTLMAGIILYVFGAGPIKGFATTLVIGICTTLFTSIFISRMIFEAYLKRNKDVTFSTSATENMFRNVNFDFIGNRKFAYIVSSILLVIGISSLVIRGLDPGVDFTGGRNFIIKFDQPVSTQEVSKLLTDEFGQAPSVITFGAEEQVRITTRYKIDDDSQDIDEEIQQKLYAGLKPLLAENTDFDTFYNNNWQSNQKVGPTIADDIKRQAVLAIFLSLIGMFIYIFIRFRNWRYGLGAVLALIHDSLIVIGAFSLLYGIMPFSLEIDQSFIAAILTVIGYSINDTVIIFDRIREYIKLHPKRERKEIMNMAMNSTLGRTFNTSFTTIIVLIAIFIFGGETIRGFIFALLIGIVIGTYSSVFVASPIVYDTVKRAEKFKDRILKK
jgi:SecD/SecF fusion protein